MTGHIADHPDAAWVTAIRAGKADAIEKLHEVVRQRLGVAIGGRVGVSEPDLDDFTQDACIRVLESIGSFRGEARFTTWVTTVAVRVAMTSLRQRRWSREKVAQQLDEDLHSDAIETHAGHCSEVDELLAALRSAIDDQLTTRQRQVIVGELAGIPQVVIAEYLSSTPNAIYKMSHDARRKLRDALAGFGFDPDAVRSILHEASKEMK